MVTLAIIAFSALVLLLTIGIEPFYILFLVWFVLILIYTLLSYEK